MTYNNDLVPEVLLSTIPLAFLGTVLVGIGVLFPEQTERRFPQWIGLAGLGALAVLTVAILLDRYLLVAGALTLLTTVGALLGAGFTLEPRRALLLGGALSLVVGLPTLTVGFGGVFAIVAAVLPLAFVSAGLAGRTLLDQLTTSTDRDGGS